MFLLHTASMVAAIRMGRRIYGNLQHAVSYLLAIHIPIAGLSVIPILLNMPLILLPAHIAFLHLIIEPVCSIAFEAEPEDVNIMKRVPRASDERLYSRAILIPVIVQGMSVLIILMIVFFVAWKFGNGESDARALAFTTLVVANLGLIIGSVARSEYKVSSQKNKALRWVILGSIAMLSFVLYIPSLRTLFRFSYLHGFDLILCVAAGVSSSLWFWFLKGMRRR